MGEEIGDKETGLEFLTLVQMGGQGLIRDISRGNGKDGCWREGFERHQEGDVGTGCFLITVSSEILTTHGLQNGVLPLCQALCATWVTYFHLNCRGTLRSVLLLRERRESKITDRTSASRDW